MVLPKLIQKSTSKPRKDGDKMVEGQSGEQEDAAVGKENQEGKKKKRKRRTTQEVDVQLIAERSTYICNKCDRKFNREATLRWHIEYDHKSSVDGEDEDDEDEDLQDDDDAYRVRDDPEYKKQKLKDEDGGSRPYSCEFCGSRFREPNVMRTHMLTHSNTRHYVCSHDNCTYAFKTKGSLTRHMRRHTGERPYECELCGRKFTESGALTRHMKSRTPCTAKTDADLPRYGKKWDFVPNIPAAVANITSKEGSDIQASADASAITEKTGSASLDVPLTDGGVDVVISTNTAAASGGNMGEMGGESLESLDATEDLTAITTEEESIRLENLSPTQCRVCREDFFAFDILRLHLRTHLADTPFRCGLCHFVAEKREELQTHMTSQHQTQLKGFENGTVLATDLTETEKPADRSRVCRNAQIAVRQLLELSPPESGFTDTENTQIESTKVLHKCPACSRTFRGSSYLKQHMKSHTGERPFKCPLCVKTFTSKDTLNKHLGAHSDERHFKCGECGKLFKRISHVREHLKIHSNDRPYCCQICDKTFKTTNALKVHLRTHTDVMPYECRFCERHFREKGSLARHMRMHTGERPYKCNHCGRGFGEHGTLNRHLKAKVPCTKQLILERQLEKSSKEDDVCYPTVLAEFSSVVADTQQYMIPEGGELQEATPEEYGEATEFVVVHTDLGSENVQNVEIITEGEIDPAILDQMTDDGTSYVVVSDSSDNIRVLDPRTGATVAVMPADSDQIQTVAMMPSENEIEAVAMAPLAEEPDTIQQAMLVANVVEEQGEGTLETTEQSTETEHVEATTA